MNRIKGLSFTVVILLFMPMTSCFVAKEYEQPKTNTENFFRTDNLSDKAYQGMDSTSIATVSWKSLFADNLLNDYIQKALENNLDIRIALQNVDAAAAYVKQGKAGYWPSIGVGLNYNYSHTPKNSRFGEGDFNQFDLSANLSWEADIWGKIRSTERAYTASYLQSVEAHKAVSTRLVAGLASTYYQLAALTEQIQIAEETILARDSSLTTTKSLKEAGLLTEVAVQQSQAQLLDAQLILLNLKRQERILENVFCMLMNEPSHAVQRNPLAQQNIQTPLRTGVPADLLANRPDIKQAEYGLIQAFELTNVARSNFYPSLTISAASGLQSLDIKDWLSANSIFANLAGGLLQPVFNRRQIRTTYEVAEVQKEKALLHYQAMLLTAGNEVSNALYEYQIQTDAIEIETKQYEAYRNAADQSEQLLINGLANYLEVLTARQYALSAQLSLVSARYAQLNAIISLYEALGGGWK